VVVVDFVLHQDGRDAFVGAGERLRNRAFSPLDEFKATNLNSLEPPHDKPLTWKGKTALHGRLRTIADRFVLAVEEALELEVFRVL